MCCVCYGSQNGSIQRLNNWFSGSIHGTFWTFQYCRLLLSKRSSSPWRRGLGKSSEGSGRPFPGTIWELCDWRIQSKEGVRQEKKVGRREWKAPFFILSFTFSFKHLHIFFSECSVEKCYANAEKFREGTYPFLLVGTPCPFSVQTIFGVGLPRAAHFKDTNGPGCKVWSMNRYVIMGEASEMEENIGIKFCSVIVVV